MVSMGLLQFLLDQSFLIEFAKLIEKQVEEGMWEPTGPADGATAAPQHDAIGINSSSVEILIFINN